MLPKTYNAVAGKNRGFDYEDKIAALFALRCLLPKNNVKDFWVAVNVDDETTIGNFDDVVLYVEKTDNSKRYYCFQLSHAEAQKRTKKLHYDSFCESVTGKFSLKVHQEFYPPPPRLDETSLFYTTDVDFTYVLFTNRPCPCPYYAARFEDEEVFNTGGFVFRFERCTSDSVDAEFLGKVYNFTDQTPEELVAEEVEDVVGELLGVGGGGCDFVATTFIKYVQEWTATRKKRDCLTKRQLQEKLAQIFVEPLRYVPEGVATPQDNATWRRIVQPFRLIIIDRTGLNQDGLNVVLSTDVEDTETVLARTAHDVLRILKAICYAPNLRRVVLLVDGLPDVTKNVPTSCAHFECLRDLPAADKNVVLSAAVKFQGRTVQLSDFGADETDVKVHHVLSVLMQQFVVGADMPRLPSRHVERFVQPILLAADVFKIVNVYIVIVDGKKAFHDYVDVERSRIPIDAINLSYETPNHADRMFNLCNVYHFHVLYEKQYRKRADVYGRYAAFRLSDGGLTSARNADAIQMFVVFVESSGTFRAFAERFQINVQPYELFEASDLDFDNVPFGCKYVLCRGDVLQTSDCQRLRRRRRDAAVHFVRIHAASLQLEWLYTYGNCLFLRRYQHAEAALHEPDNNVMRHFDNAAVSIINGSPGIGKSVLLNYVAAHGPKDVWMLRVDLNRFAPTDADASVDGFDAFLRRVAGDASSNGFALTHLNRCLVERRAWLLFDGFDEVETMRFAPICRLIRRAEAERVPVFVTTRPVLAAYLEREINCASKTLKPFTVVDQKTYLVERFVDRVAHPRHKIVRFVDALLDATNSCANVWDNDFVGVPLQTRLISKVFLDDCESFCRNEPFELPQRMDVIKLYEMFVDHKFKHLFDRNEPAPPPPYISKMYKEATVRKIMLCAVNLLFPELFASVEIADFVGDVRSGDERSGFIENVDDDGKPVFGHRTFVEYFVALYIYTYFDDEIRLRRIVDRLYDRTYDSIRKILDRLLARGCALHGAVLNADVGAAEELVLRSSTDLNERDRWGRTALHLAASWASRHKLPTETQTKSFGNVATLRVLLDDVKTTSPVDRIVRRLLDAGWDVDAVDEAYKRKPMRYALLSFALETIDAFVDRLDGETVIDDLYKRLRKDCTTVADDVSSGVLFLCAVFDYPRVAHEILHRRNGGDGLRTKRYGNCDVSLLQLVALHGSRRTYDAVVRQHEVNYRDGNGNRPLHFAALHGNDAVAELLVVGGADVNATNLNNETALHVATRAGHLEIVRSLLAKNAAVETVAFEGYVPFFEPARWAELISVFVYPLRSITHCVLHSSATALHVACKNKRTDIGTLLMDAGAASNVRDDAICTPLHITAYNGCAALVAALIAAKANVNVADATGLTPLHRALYGNNAEVARMLLEAGAKPNKPDAERLPPIYGALLLGNVAVVELLLDKGADIGFRGPNGTSAMYIAALNGDLPMVELLLGRRNADVNRRGPRGFTPLISSMCHFNINAKSRDDAEPSAPPANLFVSHGDMVTPYSLHQHFSYTADVDYQVHPAFVGRDDLRDVNTKIALLLIENGGDVHCTTDDGMTAFAFACFLGYPDVVDALIERGALRHDVPSLPHCLHVAASGGNADVVRLLARHVPTVDVDNVQNLTPLYVAVCNGHAAAARVLVELGADVKKLYPNMSTSLQMACSLGYEEMARCLIDAGADADVDCGDYNFVTPLMVSSLHGHLDIVKLLLAHGCKVDRQVLAKDGKFSALHLATSNGRCEVVKVLLEYGADKNLRDANSETALDMARRLQHLDIVHLLNA